MVSKPIKDIDPVIWDYLDRSYSETSMDGVSHHPCGGFYITMNYKYKDLILILLILSGFVIYSGNVFAISGACSYHGGVNCSIGSDYDGSVVCNDGWSDSNITYIEASECIATRCTTQADLDKVRALNINNGLAGSDFASSNTAQCEAEIISSGGSNTPSIDIDQWINDYVERETAKEIANQRIEYEYQISRLNLSCYEKYGPYISYNPNSNICECDKGYEFNNIENRCRQIPTSCPEGFILLFQKCYEMSRFIETPTPVATFIVTPTPTPIITKDTLKSLPKLAPKPSLQKPTDTPTPEIISSSMPVPLPEPILESTQPKQNWFVRFLKWLF